MLRPLGGKSRFQSQQRDWQSVNSGLGLETPNIVSLNHEPNHTAAIYQNVVYYMLMSYSSLPSYNPALRCLSFSHGKCKPVTQFKLKPSWTELGKIQTYLYVFPLWDDDLVYRSTVFIQAGCRNEPCRKKDPIPQKKVYSRRTAEIGVYIDRQLYQEMGVSHPSRD